MTRDAILPLRRSVDDSHALMNCRTKTDVGFVVLGYNPDVWGPRIVSQENIPRILPLGFVFHASWKKTSEDVRSPDWPGRV